jgi:hypothetical protein
LAPLLSFIEIGLLPSSPGSAMILFHLRSAGRKSGELISGRLIFRIDGHERLMERPKLAPCVAEPKLD